MFKQGNEHNQVFCRDCNLEQVHNIFKESISGAIIKFSLISMQFKPPCDRLKTTIWSENGDPYWSTYIQMVLANLLKIAYFFTFTNFDKANIPYRLE